MSERKITVSFSTLLLIVGAVLLLFLLWQLRSLLVVLMIAVVIAATLAPVITIAESFRVPRWLAVIGVYLGLISILTGVVLLIGPTVVDQIQKLIRKLPLYLEIVGVLVQSWAVRLGMTEPQVLEQLNRLFDLQALTAWAFRSSQELLIRSYGITRGVIGGILSLILAFMLSGYMLSGSDKLIKGFVSLFPAPWDEQLLEQVQPMSERMGSYIQGRIVVSGILGIVITIGLRLLGISELALGLGVIAAVTNLIPFFGPVLGAVPALIVAIAQGGWTFFSVLLLFTLIQNLETYVLDPLLVGSSVKVNPLYQLLAVLGGAQVLGILGAVIVPPWVAGAAVLLDNLYLKTKPLPVSLTSTATPSLSDSHKSEKNQV
ncbi:AI-2E family transporter [Picosynechococcus sp. PCC 11901]|uniref:AI-2E family transporter n=1 Tax=Picosynechococcus sp. PCC 11901 TaxID=2579791 RepID=UPI0010FBF2D9|nr:AI-2E family transporter [Picosynechococcus sp. PCC 11901]QCS50470.1 AI-2E family transporter [Picosynechococcus sp. PCC 11901]